MNVIIDDLDLDALPWVNPPRNYEGELLRFGRVGSFYRAHVEAWREHLRSEAHVQAWREHCEECELDALVEMLEADDASDDIPF